MSLVNEQQVPDRAPSPSQPEPTTNQARRPDNNSGGNQMPPALLSELASRASWKAGVIGSLNVVTAVLAVRLILLLATLGAAILTFIALENENPLRLAALGVFTCTVVLPLVWLSSRQ
jgi:hypothetical protein